VLVDEMGVVVSPTVVEGFPSLGSFLDGSVVDGSVTSFARGDSDVSGEDPLSTKSLRGVSTIG
jgi:hypothetical protein